MGRGRWVGGREEGGRGRGRRGREGRRGEKGGKEGGGREGWKEGGKEGGRKDPELKGGMYIHALKDNCPGGYSIAKPLLKLRELCYPQAIKMG